MIKLRGRIIKPAQDWLNVKKDFDAQGLNPANGHIAILLINKMIEETQRAFRILQANPTRPQYRTCPTDISK